LRAITEDILRLELRNSQPEVYYIPTGKILTPAAREYLQQRKIKIAKEGECPQRAPEGDAAPAAPQPAPQPVMAAPKPKYVDYQSGSYYMEKPEHMTQLFDNQLVAKNHPRILFRGKLDSLQALVVLDQALISDAGGSQQLLADLDDVLKALRNLMRCDVLDEELHSGTIIGLTHGELREHSHNPMKFYNIRQMILPSYTMGRDYALLNQLRAAIRETEVAAANAFYDGFRFSRSDIIEELNRLSSALHIMMCKYLAGEYKGVAK